jgi:hypothetical protein
MEITRLPIERVKAQTSKKSSRQIKTHGQNTPRAESFKNPLLGIEVNLLKQLQEVNARYFETSYHKRNVLLDALEDLASTGLGFQQQLRDLVRAWRPENCSNPTLFEATALKDLMHAQRVCRDAVGDKSAQEKRCQELTEEIRNTEAITMKYYNDIEQMKKRLHNESDHFALGRKLNRELGNLERDFMKMFSDSRKSRPASEMADLEAENARLRGQVYRQRYELEICEHISAHLRLGD